jgi:hypothetical protein
MPRRIFTTRDLAPLREITQRIIEREPDAAVVAAAASPFKRRIPTAEHEERTEVRLPVDVAASTTPEGVPLHEIAKAVQKEFPGVTGVSVTPGGVSLKFDKKPTAAQRRKIDSLLSDKARLEELKPAFETPGPAAAALGAAPARAEDDLVRVLRDPETSDAAWLRAFRAYAVTHLVEAPEEPPAEPPGTPEK